MPVRRPWTILPNNNRCLRHPRHLKDPKCPRGSAPCIICGDFVCEVALKTNQPGKRSTCTDIMQTCWQLGPACIFLWPDISFSPLLRFGIYCHLAGGRYAERF